MLDDGNDDADAFHANAAFVIATNLIAELAAGSNLSVSVEMNGKNVGTLTIEVVIRHDGKVKFKVSEHKPVGIDDEASVTFKLCLRAALA